MSEVATKAPLLEVRGVSKRFGATQALSDVSFDLMPGEVHALMGENGAGKSTLMKIISGNYTPDAGTIQMLGEQVVMASPRDAMTAGVGIIHQELNTFPDMTVAENLAIGNEPSRAGLLDRRKMIEDARRKLDHVGATGINPKMPIGRLSVGMQQMVEIARAVAEDVKVLVLDEPTAALSTSESHQLFALIREMRERGMGLIYISHRMEEVWDLADRVTVFRDGKLVGTRNMRGTGAEAVTPNDIVRMMVGRDVDDLYGHDRQEPGDTRLEVRDLTDGEGIGPVSFDVRGGEIVSMVGLIGAGRTEVGRLLYGADKPAGGTVRLDGHELQVKSPRDAISKGIGMLPESRKDQALFLEMSVQDNTAMSTLDDYSSFGVVSLRKIRTKVARIFEALSVRAASQNVEARSLSGGNQQKLVLGRLMLEEPSLLILDEPTRGVDIGAKSEIYRIIKEIAETGTAVLVISSDLPEALGISDRLLVMRQGRIVAELDAPSATEEIVMEHATGVYADEHPRNDA
ncbi:sugar ABC transporter ATP-binding protein [Tessaracoccus sp. OS52]|uniref:sugar ABC transporter ATP-binding protein n=1 Tax=Tessaracoccus sp. OS52 TaxID=2886691 RepID=UPI001D123A5D|nr:sugar ABC transporter ATP-binding protein [Tessaracoccus sp. OS52]MCC2593268.1 sugar ABC transporter ATP-binding protein [Tessaracoccus sp. OS52]